MSPSGYQENVDAGVAQAGWVGHCLLALTELNEVIAPLAEMMRQAHYSARDIFGMQVGVEEAMVNAVKHGHMGRKNLPVWIRYQVTAKQVLVEVEDQGPGFNPRQVADPRAPGNLERTSGRGLFLMRYYATWVQYNERGNRVTLCKRRSPAPNHASPED
jgi:serine/threonine-protein kinase RsbW